jgi:hypothetical protein
MMTASQTGLPDYRNSSCSARAEGLNRLQNLLF